MSQFTARIRPWCWIILMPVTVMVLFPLIWMIRVALLPSGTVVDLHTVWGERWTAENLIVLLKGNLLWRPLLNSIIVVTAVTAGNLLFCMMTGYALARRRTPLATITFLSILTVIILPTHLIMIPLYLMAIKTGLYDSYAALILPWVVTPLGIFLVRQYVLSVPTAMEEAARIDGASEWRILFQIVMPVCRPILAVLAIQVFFVNWNSFLFPFILTSSDSLRTLPVALAMLQGQQSVDWTIVMAGALLAIAPVLLFYIVMQPHIVAGLTAGAVKQ